MRLEALSAGVLAIYMAAFLMYDTVLVGWLVSGLFYPFYLAFVMVPVALLVTTGVRLQVVPLALFLVFVAVVAGGVVRAQHPPNFDVVQQLVVVLLGPLALIQIQDRGGLRAVRAALTLSAVPLVAWTLQAAWQQGFTGRAAVASDPNVAAFYLVLTLPAVASWGHDQAVSRDRGRRLKVALAVLLIVAVVYAVVLQASRGLLLAAAVTLAAMGVLLLVRYRRPPAALWWVSLPAVALPWLPGVNVLAERFTTERVASGGLRTLIWEATLAAHTQGGFWDAFIGRGMLESRAMVAGAFATLTSTHNAFLHVLVEYGFVGVVVMTALLLLPLSRAGRLPTGDALLAVGLVAALAAAAMTLNTSETFLFWVALGVANAAVWLHASDGMRS